jgi:hypothetical protein
MKHKKLKIKRESEVINNILMVVLLSALILITLYVMMI